MTKTSTMKKDRRATEDTILKAFGRLLLREGTNGIGINALAREAGVNKVLIYRYFGDIPSLAQRWAESSSFWPSEMELIGEDEKAFAQLTVHERVKFVLKSYVTAIRRRPHTIEFLKSQLVTPNDITRALDKGVGHFGRGVNTYIQNDSVDTLHGDKVWALIVMVSAMTAYFCIRERTNPEYLDMDFSQEESWTFLLQAIDTMADAFLTD